MAEIFVRAGKEHQPKSNHGLVLAFGQESLKWVDGRRQRAVPLVGLEVPEPNQPEYLQLGVGIVLPESGSLLHPRSRRGLLAAWGHPRNVIQSWRAMKIVESLGTVDREMLRSSWEAAGVVQGRVDRALVDAIGEEKLFALREDLILQAPPRLERMLAALKDRGIPANFRELESELGRGTISKTPLVEWHISQDKLEFNRYRLQEMQRQGRSLAF